MPEVTADENTIFELEPTEITVKDGLPRQRKDMGEIHKMVTSIQTFGQLQPIVINRNNELIAGGRRLAACILGGFKARVCYTDTVDPVIMREMELEENIQRKSLTPAEEALAIAELVKLKQKTHGKPVQGQTGGFTLENMAELLGMSRSNVIENIQIAEHIQEFPNLADCKSKSDIKKAYKGLERIQTNLTALASYEATIQQEKEFILVNRIAEEYMANFGNGIMDLFFTDPPYGIGIHDVAMTTGGETGGEQTTTGIKYDDSEESAKELLAIICIESYRITKDTGHAYIFCAPSHFWWLSEQMAAAGWLVAPRPIIWIKRETGQNNQPERWPSAAYEFILFARKPNSSLVLQGRPDWIQCDPVLPSIRVHQAEKPVTLCKELIARVCNPGAYMLDPCMGSGAIVEAGVHMKVLSMGCEKEIESYAAAVARMQKMKEGK
jgi:ParB/RepB/Spo0J family partition protein